MTMVCQDLAVRWRICRAQSFRPKLKENVYPFLPPWFIHIMIFDNMEELFWLEDWDDKGYGARLSWYIVQDTNWFEFQSTVVCGLVSRSSANFFGFRNVTPWLQISLPQSLGSVSFAANPTEMPPWLLSVRRWAQQRGWSGGMPRMMSKTHLGVM